MNKKEICWLDTSNQIGNSWYRNTSFGIYFENSGLFFGLDPKT